MFCAVIVFGIASVPLPVWGGLSLLILGIVVWRLPKLQANAVADQVEIRDRAFIEDAHRRTLIQALGGLFFLTTAYLSRRNIQITENQEVTARFSKAVELLGDDRLEVRLGGIYLLERVAKDSPVDHWIVMEVLTSYIRDKSVGRNSRSSLPTDIQAALTVIGRRETQNDLPGGQLDLSETNLSQALLMNANLGNVNLKAANLTKANLEGSDLEGANLAQAILRQANLSSAHLNRANGSGANFSQANLFSANLEATNLLQADLSEATLSKAILISAMLVEANLSQASLAEATLSGANLIGANLLEANLTAANLTKTELRAAQNLTVEQVQSAANGAAAIYDPEFRTQLEATPLDLESREN
ncbi:MAG: pentapeptide repeat-containing protein [Thermosynechococcaceae cyanobacterium]